MGVRVKDVVPGVLLFAAIYFIVRSSEVLESEVDTDTEATQHPKVEHLSLRKSPVVAKFSPSQLKLLEEGGHASSCYLPTNWVDLPLLSVQPVNHDSKIYEFGLPPGQSLNLPTCACLLVAPPGEDVVRPYTPISGGEMLGKFQLLIKHYEKGQISGFVKKMAVGDMLRFKVRGSICSCTPSSEALFSRSTLCSM